MKILIAHDGALSSDTTVEDMRRAGLPQDANALVVCIGGEGLPHQSRVVAETAGNRIQSQFPQWKVSSEAFSGSPAEVILKTSGWWRPDLLIIGSDTFALQRSMTSGVSLDVVHRARCSVRMARTALPASAASGPVRLLIGHNGSKACKAVIHEVARRHWPGNTEAHVISVVDTASPQHDKLEQIHTAEEDCVDRLRDAGLTVYRRFIDGDPRQALLRESERCNADTIFVGPRCLHGMERFLLGSVATAVVTRARSTVEIVRQN